MFCVLISLVLGIAASQNPPTGVQGQNQPLLPPPRVIPGLTAKDQFPRGCVDCHLNYVEQKLDVRFSTLLKQWTEQVEPQLLKKAAGAAPSGLTLKGKHPEVLGMVKTIPTDCLICHAKDSATAPPFARMVHAIHLTGGKDSHFLTLFQGECTHCHKLDAATGAWSLASGTER